MNNNVVQCIELDDSDSSVVAFVPTTRKPLPSQASLLDDSDSDDSLLLTGGPIFSNTTTSSSTSYRRQQNSSEVQSSSRGVNRKLSKQQRVEERRKEKEQREEQKRQEKLAREEERSKKRAEKDVAKCAEQEAKRRRIESAQQTSGKFAPKEIAILMDPQLMQCMGAEGLQETYAVHPHSDGARKGSVRWIRKDLTAGGAQDAIQSLKAGRSSGYELLDRLVIVFHEPKEFIKMLQRSDDDDDYPLLESWLQSLEFRGKIVLLLHQVTDALHREWNAHRRTKQNPPPPTDAELDDAIVWLLIQFQVECIKCLLEEQVLQMIKKMTRALSEKPYQQQVTELECIKKIKSVCPDNADDFAKANDCWIRQLQQVPRVSEAMARHLAQYFPTARSLWDAYQDQSRTEDEKRLLIASLFKEGRQHPKLADMVYRLMTSVNPNEFL